MLTAVLTGQRPRLTRRRLLLAAPATLAAGALAACTDSEEPAPPEDPDRVALTSALDVELALYLTVGNLDAAGPDAVVPVATVQAHVDALDQALGQEPSLAFDLTGAGSGSPTASATPSATGMPTAPIEVGEAARAADQAADTHTRALRETSPDLAPLLASIAASDAALAAFLRRLT
jgi:hypothetical protein